MAATPEPIPAVVFLGPAGVAPAERWMSAARRACAADLIERLAGSGFGPIYLAAPDSSDFVSPPTDVQVIADSEGPFHFGRALAGLVDTRRFTALAYFGAASAPLATAATLAGWLDQARRLSPGGALVNNLHSSDWAILNDARSVVALADRLPTDNPLGWVLSREAGVRVETPPAAVAARADIDTPGDLALVRGHPDLGPRLRLAVEAIPLELGRRVGGLARVLRTPAETVALIGRVSEAAWRDMVRQSRVWVRVFAEERGMRASGRLARGEVRSLLAEMVEAEGPDLFVARLAKIAQGVIWDTRVWMAHRGGWPSAADRMAADLGWAEEIVDPALRALTEAVIASPVPVLTGGQGVVSGCLRAFLEAESGESGQGD